MVQVAVESTMIDSLIIGIGTLAIVLIVFFGIYAYNSYVNPKEAKEIKKAKQRKLPLILTASLSHFADLFAVTELIPEGVMETFPFGKGIKKRSLRFQLPRKYTVDSLEVADNKDADITRELLQKVLDLNSEKVILRDARSPLFIAVRDKSVAAGIKGIGALGFLNKLEKLSKIKEKIAVLKTTEGFTEIGKLLEDFHSEISLIDFDAIRQNLALGWDQTIDESLQKMDENLGERKVGKGKNDFKTMCLYLGVALIGAALFIAVFYMVTSGGK
jgi:hypothetical protein